MRSTRLTTPLLKRAIRSFSSTPSSQLARMTLVGRLGTDPEVLRTPNGRDIVKYAVAVGSGPPDNRHTSWFRISAFPLEGSVQRDKVMGLSKGTLIYLEGDATMRTYEDSQGAKRTDLSLVQTRIEVLKRPNPQAVQESAAS